MEKIIDRKIEELLKKEQFDFYDLVGIMEILRSKRGCPWDREQTHESIKKNFIEETYEVVEAIEADNPEMLCEELGDVLLQVAFHTQMESEKGNFKMDDVTGGICRKLILRHPHIFGDVKADTSEKVLRNWDEIKTKEKGYKTQTQALINVPRQLPALMRSQKIQQKAAKVGFDWDRIDGALEKLREELLEVEQALEAQDKKEAEKELGDLLFAAVNVGRFLNVDCEEALTRTCEKFIERFSYIEEKAKGLGKDIKDMSLQEMDKLWDEAKGHFKA